MQHRGHVNGEGLARDGVTSLASREQGVRYYLTAYHTDIIREMTTGKKGCMNSAAVQQCSQTLMLVLGQSRQEIFYIVPGSKTINHQAEKVRS